MPDRIEIICEHCGMVNPVTMQRNMAKWLSIRRWKPKIDPARCQHCGEKLSVPKT